MGSLHCLDVPLAILGVYLLRRVAGTKKILPPGPTGWPVIGNLLEWPKENEWLTFAKWADQYGDLVYVNLAGTNVVLVNNPSLAADLFNRKGGIYSDRPHMVMACDLVGWKNAPALSAYTDRLKEMRRWFAATIGSKKVLEQFVPMEEVETARFLRRVMDNPTEISHNVRKLAGAIILNISHGYSIQENDDPWVALANNAMKNFSVVTTPGSFLVDILPFLNYLPSWMPGTGFKKVASDMRTTLRHFLDNPHNWLKEQMAAGNTRPSFVGRLLDKTTLTEKEEEDVKWAAVGLYGGGSDTTVSAIHTFFLAMALNPSIQAIAQAEIDRVIGSDRLPALHDRANLPYVDALVKEILRWGLVVPQGLPHIIREDDIVNGYFIPKGTMLIQNIYKFVRNPATYSNPTAFDPLRFVPASSPYQTDKTHEPETDPRAYVFGIGRRTCPGSALADQSVWLACAMALASLDVSKARDSSGSEIEPEVRYIGAIITHPQDFECCVKPRSVRAESITRSLADSSF